MIRSGIRVKISLQPPEDDDDDKMALTSNQQQSERKQSVAADRWWPVWVVQRVAELLAELRIFKCLSLRSKLLSFMYFSHLWYPLRKQMLLNQAAALATTAAANAAANANAKPLPPTSVGWLAKREDRNQIWLPEIPEPLVIYRYLATAIHSINLINTSMIKFRTVAQNRVADDFFICYMPRAHFHEIISQKNQIWYSLVFSLFHLSWRAFILMYGKHFRLDAISFLLTSSEQQRPEKLQPECRRNFYKKGVPYQWNYADSLLFCEMNLGYKNRFELRLRPNRTQEAREKLIRQTNLSFAFMSTASLVACSILPICFSDILLKHEQIFEDCRITYWDWIYWYRTVTSLCLMTVQILDTYIQFPLCTGLLYILVSDAMLYWAHVEKKLRSSERLLHASRINSLALTIPMMGCQSQQQQLNNNNNNNTAGYVPRFSCRHHLLQNRDDFLYNNYSSYHDHIKRDLIETRTLVHDFFRKLREMDKFVSVVIFFAFYIWLATNAISSLTSVRFDTLTAEAMTIRFLQMIGLFFLGMISLLALYVRSFTLPAYTTMCSLMALDPSVRKFEWIELLAPYTHRRQCYAFTFFGSGVFDTLMFLKLTSYTLTLIAYFKAVQ